MKKLLLTIFILALILCFAVPAFAIKILPYNVPLQDLMRWDKYGTTLILSNPEGETLSVAWASTVDFWNYDGSTWTFDLPSGDTFKYSKVVDLYAGMKLAGTAITSTAAEINKLDGWAGAVADLTFATALNLLMDAGANEAEIITGKTLNIKDNEGLKIADTAVTSIAAELNILDGALLTVTELNYVDGVTSAIQTQIDAKQALDAGLTSIAALTYTSDSFVKVTATDIYAIRTITETKTDLALNNVDNTSDANKPVSTAGQTALDLKAPLAAPTFTGAVTISGSIATVEKTPVNAVASEGTLTSDATAPSDTDTVTIDTKTYTFKTTLTPTEGEVLIGANAAAALDNLKSAINHTGTPDTDYSCAAVHPTVTATTNTDTTQIVQAKTKGVAGNSIAFEEASTHLSVDAATLGATVAGVDGTVGVANETVQDATYLYVCINTNTIADANWRRVSLGSAY